MHGERDGASPQEVVQVNQPSQAYEDEIGETLDDINAADVPASIRHLIAQRDKHQWQNRPGNVKVNADAPTKCFVHQHSAPIKVVEAEVKDIKGDANRNQVWGKKWAESGFDYECPPCQKR